MSFRKDAGVPFQGLSVGGRREGEWHVITLAGELDLATRGGVERELERVGGTDARYIVLDLRELEFIDCGGVWLIVMAHVRELGRLVVVQGPPCVRRVFELSGVAGLLLLVDEPPQGEGNDPTDRNAAGDDRHAAGCS